MASSDPSGPGTDAGQAPAPGVSSPQETGPVAVKEESVKETGDTEKGASGGAEKENSVSGSDPGEDGPPGAAGGEAEGKERGDTPPVDDSESGNEGTDASKSTSESEKVERSGDKGVESQVGEQTGEKTEQPAKGDGGKKELPGKETDGEKGDDHGKKETKSSQTSAQKSPSAKQEASKPWSFFRSSTTTVETREYFENLPLTEKRKLYRCGSKYKQLKDIETWPVFQAAHGCISTRALRTPRQPDPSISNKVSLWRGDITSLEIDAIVNAANSSLMGGGGVDGAIHDAAGRSLGRECMDLNGCATGGAKITGGHRLPAKFILHTVGPIGENPNQLTSCYERCLELVEQHKIKSVAFCCISTGIYGYPNSNAAVRALTTVRKWLESSEYAKNELERVIFCVFLKMDYDIYSELMCLFFPAPDPDPAPPIPDGGASTGEKGKGEREEREKTPPVYSESPASNSSTPLTGVPQLTSSVTAPPVLQQQAQGESGVAEGVHSKEGVDKLPEAGGGAEGGADTGENMAQGKEVGSSSKAEGTGGEPNAKQPKLEKEVPKEPGTPEPVSAGSEPAEGAAPASTGEKGIS